MFQIEWDSQAIAQRDSFMQFQGEWDYFLEHSAKDLAEYAQTYFTPMLKGVRSSPGGNGDTAKSVQPSIAHNSNGFEISYNGLLSAYWLDVGNFPASQYIEASTFGLKSFPVDKRHGINMPMAKIHGMGHFTPGVPLHWSEETVKHMNDDDIAFEIMEKWLNVFLDEVVIKA